MPLETAEARLITADADMRHALSIAAEHSWVALDTEFVRENTYYPRLCLVQIAACDQLFLLDVLALADLTPLAKLLRDSRVTKVLHAVDQDAEVLLHSVDAIPAPLFDTQVAASLLGIGDQIGYAGAVEAVLGKTLPKGHQRTDWSRRPLKSEEMAYAADDVRYLAPLYRRLKDSLEARNRQLWLSEDCAALTTAERYITEPEQAWRKLKGLGRLQPAEQHIAANLAEWRERRAMQYDRPRRWILKDEVLLALATQRPQSASALAGIDGLPEKMRRSPDELLEVVNRPTSSGPALVSGSGRPDPALRKLTRQLQDQVKTTAEELDIPPSLLANRRDLEALATGQRDVAVLHGWRREAIGNLLLQLLTREADRRGD